MRFVFPPPPVPGLPIMGSEALFPVRRIFCVARNYAAHAREMGGDPEREPPFFFCKPGDGIVPSADTPPTPLPYPGLTKNFHHEVEMVAAIGKGGKDIPAEHAQEHVFGYAIGLDMTRRDIQIALRDKGRPWEPGKAFDHSSPIGPIHPATSVGHPIRGAIWLTVNGEPRQRGDLADMSWSPAEVIAQVSTLFELQPGDLVFTGTPEGVGPVVPGDRIDAGIDGLGRIALEVR